MPNIHIYCVRIKTGIEMLNFRSVRMNDTFSLLNKTVKCFFNMKSDHILLQCLHLNLEKHLFFRFPYIIIDTRMNTELHSD